MQRRHRAEQPCPAAPCTARRRCPPPPPRTVQPARRSGSPRAQHPMPCHRTLRSGIQPRIQPRFHLLRACTAAAGGHITASLQQALETPLRAPRRSSVQRRTCRWKESASARANVPPSLPHDAGACMYPRVRTQLLSSCRGLEPENKITRPACNPRPAAYQKPLCATARSAPGAAEPPLSSPGALNVRSSEGSEAGGLPSCLPRALRRGSASVALTQHATRVRPAAGRRPPPRLPPAAHRTAPAPSRPVAAG